MQKQQRRRMIVKLRVNYVATKKSQKAENRSIPFHTVPNAFRPTDGTCTWERIGWTSIKCRLDVYPLPPSRCCQCLDGTINDFQKAKGRDIWPLRMKEPLASYGKENRKPLLSKCNYLGNGGDDFYSFVHRLPRHRMLAGWAS